MLHGKEVPASVELGPPHQVVVALDKLAHRHVIAGQEHRCWHGATLASPAIRASSVLSPSRRFLLPPRSTHSAGRESQHCVDVYTDNPIRSLLGHCRRNPARHGALEAIDADHCRLHFGGDSYADLAWMVTVIGVDFTVTEPSGLIEAIDVLGRRCLRAAGSADRPRPDRP